MIEREKARDLLLDQLIVVIFAASFVIPAIREYFVGTLTLFDASIAAVISVMALIVIYRLNMKIIKARRDE